MTQAGSAVVGLNGRLLPAGEARISPLGEGFLFGAGVFETIKIIDDRPAFFAEHMKRLRRGAAELRLALFEADGELRDRCAEVIDANRLGNGSLKIVVFEDVGGTGKFITVKKGGYPPELYARGFRLRTVPDGRRTGRVPGLKSLNYLKNLFAKREAQAGAFDEPLFVDDGGLVLEGATTNVFSVKDDMVMTPGLDMNILPGVVRGVLLRLRGDFKVREGAMTLGDLLTADEIFVTNSLLGVMPVGAVNEKAFDIARRRVTPAIQRVFRTAESESLA